MKADFLNEAFITAMLVASSGREEEAAQSGHDGGSLARADVLRERLSALLDRAGRAAAQAGVPADLAEAADFAACAFIDEILLSSASWSGRTEWLQKPLQFSRHDTATAGEDFYRLLDSLLEQARANASIVLPAETGNATGQPFREGDNAHSSLHAVLEVFALCLAQGFTGMFYDDHRAIRGRLDKIGRFVPAVSRCHKPFSFAPVKNGEKQKPLRSWADDLARRFDLLDIALWIIPPALTLLLYLFCRARLDSLLMTFLHGSVNP